MDERIRIGGKTECLSGCFTLFLRFDLVAPVGLACKEVTSRVYGVYRENG